jgi:SAM-dependent methyltransferase
MSKITLESEMQTFESQDRRRLYDDLAWTWPIISPPEDYADESQEFIRIINSHAKIPVGKLLNLGCGGGHNDFNLKKTFEITGVDISEAMLNLAKQLNPEVTYLTGDMRSVRLGNSFDAVTIFDSISYMRTLDSLRAAFTTAYNHLKPGGVFITYTEFLVEHFKQNRTSHLISSRDDVEITLVENYYNPDPSDTTIELNMVYFIRRAGKLSIETDSHLIGLFGLQAWLDTMRDVGFEVQQVESKIPNDAGDDCPTFVGIKP